jgi:hypothetical protein
MSSIVSFFTLKYLKLDLEGYYAFNEKPPGRYKIRKTNLLWLLRAASSSYEPECKTRTKPATTAHVEQ